MIVDGCVIKMYVDGEYYVVVIIEVDRIFYNLNLKNKVIVGVRYLVKEGVYIDRFIGYLFGFIIRFNSIFNE